MEKVIKKYIIDNNLIPNNKDFVVCATSGGVDSITLLHILYDMGYNVILAHVNHHKRIESENEMKCMKELAQRLNIPFECYDYYDNGLNNFHDSAHNMRYSFFKDVADKYKTKNIVTAHHLDDHAETIIMRLISGSNLFGYAGISNKLDVDGYNIIRPLLCVSKKDIINYAKEKNLVFFSDVSNECDDYLRNRIRHHIIPLLKKENPNFLNQINDYSSILKEAFNYIRNQSINYLNEHKNIIDLKSFETLDVAVKKDVICLLFERYNIDKSNNIISICLDVIKANTNSKIDIKKDCCFVLEYNKAYIIKKESITSYSYLLTFNDRITIMGKYVVYFSKNKPFHNEKFIKLCYNDLKLPLLVRNRQTGDNIEMNYGNKKVSRILIDQKVENKKRNEIPLFFDNDGNLLWVYDFAKSVDVIKQKQNGDIYLVCEEINND